jgi:hypothetical protein
MIDRILVNQAIAQAKEASLKLRGLLRSDLPEPDPATIRALMDQGAQSLWMSARGSTQSDHAIVLAAQCGFSSTVEVLAEFDGPLPLAKGKSIFEAALGIGRATHNPLREFAATVHALKKAGYRLENENAMKFTALETALVWGLGDHARVLMENGALLPNLVAHHMAAIMVHAMRVEGAPENLIDHAPPPVLEMLKNGWWEAIGAARMPASVALERAITAGQSLSAMTDQDFKSLSSSSASAITAFKKGYIPPPMLAISPYDPESSKEPFWRVNPEWVKEAVKMDAPLGVFNFSQIESGSGHDWLMHMLTERRILEFRDYADPPVEELAHTLRELKAQGLWDPGHRDMNGKTAGWHLAGLLGEYPRKDKYRLDCWALIEEFDLFLYPCADTQGKLQPPWNSGAAPALFEKPKDTSWLNEQKGRLAANALSAVTQPASKSTSTSIRRM